MSIWTWIWLVLAITGISTELAALCNKRDQDTLSEHVWAVIRIADSRSTRIGWALRVVSILFLGWLAGHFAFGWWTLSHHGPWFW
jgi:hypothetical protein